MKNPGLLTLIFFIACIGCTKKFDTPEFLPASDGQKLSLLQLKQRCSGTNSIYRFGTGDTNLYATVTMDESNGNIYKTVFIKDDEGNGLCLKLQEAGGLSIGDKIRINLNNCWLVCANNMVSVDSLDITKSVVKLSSGNSVASKMTSISKLIDPANYKESSNLQSQLIELNDVEFVYSARGKPYANAIGRTSLEYQLTDCQGKEIAVRTSGMSNFASKLTPTGNGKLIGVVQQYNNEMTLLIRTTNELKMENPVCTQAPPDTSSGTTYLYKDFNKNDLLSGGWLNLSSMGTTSWTTSNLGQSNYYARIYNKNNNVYELCETWLISPEIDLTTATQPVLNFLSANSSTASLLSLYLLENYVSGNPNLEHATEVPFAFQKSSFTFFSSGEIPLSTSKGKKIRLAYKYTGTASTGSIWELDNIWVQEK